MMDNKKNTTNRDGAALLVVLIIVMAITILALGFLARSDVELACGVNMLLRTQMDYLAETGLEHAKGLILNPQDVDSEYWTGAAGQQIVGGDNYYDVGIVRDDSDATDRCNYIIDCNSYRLKGGEEVGRSNLRARLRLDPCIALWSGLGTTVSSNVTVNGDVYCAGTLTNNGVINGDAFSNGLSGNEPSGQQETVGDLSLAWPRVTVADFTSNYSVQAIGGSLSDATFGPYEPVKVCYHGGGDVELASNVQIEGMLMVEGDLTIRGNGNVITAAKSLPAILVTGDLMIADGGGLDVYGLAVIDGQVQISAGAEGISVVGGLFTREDIVETTADSTGNGNDGRLYNEPSWQPSGGQIGGAVEFDGVNGRIEDADADSYLNGLSAVTVSVWVKSDVTNQNRGILFVREPTGSDEELGIRYDLSGVFGGGSSIIKASVRATSGYTQIESTSNVQTTAWQHLAMVWESGSSLKLYINGQLNLLSYDMGPVSGSVSGVEKLILGRGAKGEYWDGLIDDVRIYSRALDENEVSNVYQHIDVAGGLVAHWELDEDGNSNNTITAAPTKTAIVVWDGGGVAEKWGQAAGAFFRSIVRR